MNSINLSSGAQQHNTSTDDSPHNHVNSQSMILAQSPQKRQSPAKVNPLKLPTKQGSEEKAYKALDSSTLEDRNGDSEPAQPFIVGKKKHSHQVYVGALDPMLQEEGMSIISKED